MARKNSDESTALVTMEHAYPVLESQDTAERALAAVQANLGRIEMSDLQTVTIPTGGGLEFKLPTLENPDAMVKTITGIIIKHHLARARFEGKFGEGPKQPPRCRSLDGYNGDGVPGGRCDECPEAKFTGDEKPVCSSGMIVYMLTPGSALPIRLRLPIMSVRTARKYLVQISGSGFWPHEVFAKIELENDTNAGGVKYSRAKFSLFGETPDQWRVPESILPAVKAYAAAFSKLVALDVTDLADIPTDDQGL